MTAAASDAATWKVRPMPPRLPALALAVAVAVTACGPLRQRVEETAQTVEYCASAIEVAEAVQARDLERGLAAADDLRDSAPEEIRPDVELVHDALRRARDGDPAALAAPEAQEAATRIAEFSRDTCDPTN